jgi:hypothetical protein
MALDRVLEEVCGPHRLFRPPDLGPEDASVEVALAAFGPGRPPQWRRPTWAVEE